MLTSNHFPCGELRAGGWSTSGSVENFTGQIDEFAIYDLDGVDDLKAAGQAIADHYFVGAVITGDHDASGQLDVADLDLQAIAIAGGQNPLAYDLTGDELVNFADRQFWVDTLKQTWIGDANLDGEVHQQRHGAGVCQRQIRDECQRRVGGW